MTIFNQEVNKLLKTFETLLTEEVDLTKVFQNFTLKIAARKLKRVLIEIIYVNIMMNSRNDHGRQNSLRRYK